MTLEGIFRRRRLPHWDVADATYFITGCLAGSIPARGLTELRGYRNELDATPRPEAMDAGEWELRKHKLAFARLDQWLDGAPAVRHLEKAEASQIVRDSFYHFAGERYHLLAYVVMPSHFHWVFHPIREWCETVARRENRGTPRETIMHSLKSYTANQCNRLLGSEGTFWQDESYDHCVRDDEELERILEYVEMNPVKANLAEEPHQWRFSSAYDRRQWDIPPGEPLLPP